MLSSHPSQTTLQGRPFRPFEECWPADTRMQTRLLQERPSAAKAARKMLRHWPSKPGQAPLIRRPA